MPETGDMVSVGEVKSGEERISVLERLVCDPRASLEEEMACLVCIRRGGELRLLGVAAPESEGVRTLPFEVVAFVFALVREEGW